MLSPLALLRRAPAPVRVRVQSSAARQHARTIDDLRTPALCCYPSVMEANAQAMLERASRLGCVLRPHVKTAKTLQAATIQTGGTKRRVVVSTLAEAEFLARGGFDDILYAVPITQDKFAAADELNQRLERFHVMVDHPSTVRAITSRAVAKPLSVVVMVDCGYRRDGVDPNDSKSVALVQALCASESTVFGGLYTHGGHAYDAADAPAITRIAEAALGLGLALTLTLTLTLTPTLTLTLTLTLRRTL